MFVRDGILWYRKPAGRAPRHLPGRLRTRHQRDDVALLRALHSYPKSQTSPRPRKGVSPGR